MPDPIVVSYSELDTYRQCPLKHQWAYVERWQKPVEPNSPLSRGTLWHTVMEEHYLFLADLQSDYRGPIPERVWASVIDDCRERARVALYDQRTGEQTDDQRLIEWMYEGYLERWGVDPDWQILGVEERVNLPLPGPGEKPNDARFLIKAKLDLRVLDWNTGQTWVIDHKSGANLPSQMDLEIDDQFGLYTWMMRQVGMPVLGSIHSATRTTRNQADHEGYFGKSRPQTLEQRMHRTYLNRGEHELTNLAHDAWAAAANCYPEQAGFEPLPLYSSPDPRQCGWKCDFKQVHLLARAGRDVDEVLPEYGFEQNWERH